jgi:hypothetical protein
MANDYGWNIRQYLKHRVLNTFGLNFSRAIDGDGNFTVSAFGMSGQQVGHLTWDPKSGAPIKAKIAVGHRQVAKVGAIIGEAHEWAMAHNNSEIVGPSPHRLDINDFYPQNDPPQESEGKGAGFTAQESETFKSRTRGLPPYGDEYDRDYTQALGARKMLPPTTRPEQEQPSR